MSKALSRTEMPPEAPPTTALSVAEPVPEPLLDPRTEETLTVLDYKASRFALAIAAETQMALRRDILQAKAILELRKCIDSNVLSAAMSLMNSPLGFRTDKTKKGDLYSPDEVRE